MNGHIFHEIYMSQASQEGYRIKYGEVGSLFSFYCTAEQTPTVRVRIGTTICNAAFLCLIASGTSQPCLIINRIVEIASIQEFNTGAKKCAGHLQEHHPPYVHASDIVFPYDKGMLLTVVSHLGPRSKTFFSRMNREFTVQLLLTRHNMQSLSSAILHGFLFNDNLPPQIRKHCKITVKL